MGILKEKFGMSDEDLDRLDFGGTPFDKKKKGTKKTRGSEPGMDFQRDQFFAGMKNTSEDATSWKDFVKKAHKSSTDRWEQLKNNRVDSVQTSKRYNIEKESNFGAKLVLFLVLSAIHTTPHHTTPHHTTPHHTTHTHHTTPHHTTPHHTPPQHSRSYRNIPQATATFHKLP